MTEDADQTSTRESDSERAPDPDVTTDRDAQPRPAARRAPQRWRAAALIGALLAVLGFAIAVQVHANSSSDSLATMPEQDLIGILDDQDSRADRLRQQIAELQAKLNSLQNSGNGAAAARQQAVQEQQTLEVLLGTVAATGPGVSVRITDPSERLQPEQLLDVIEELRGAGAEAIQFGTVRISTNSAFSSTDRRLAVDGTPLAPPYDVLAIGDASTLDTALNIPGGVAAVVRAAGGNLVVTERRSVTITAVRKLPVPKYAKPSGH
jgi:uncharacterized protein YlxW (UPF0749 family)